MKSVGNPIQSRKVSAQPLRNFHQAMQPLFESAARGECQSFDQPTIKKIILGVGIFELVRIFQWAVSRTKEGFLQGRSWNQGWCISKKPSRILPPRMIALKGVRPGEFQCNVL